MTCFSDLIKNVPKSFNSKLYKIAKQYSFMLLTRVEESIGLSPITYKLELGSRDSHGDFHREPTHDEATKTQTTLPWYGDTFLARNVWLFFISIFKTPVINGSLLLIELSSFFLS